MRIAAFALLACLAGCSLTSGSGGECDNDSQCGDDVCARSGECLARASVRSVRVSWTINGAAADLASCTTPNGAPANLYIQFDGAEYGDVLRFTQVVCSSGLYTVDKLPKRYQQVELGFEGGSGDVASIRSSRTDTAGTEVQFDLFR
jgi:hypothetical protein